MTSKKTNMAFLAISTIVLLSAMPLSTQSVSEAFATQSQSQVNTMPATPTLSSDQQSRLINIAMSVSGVNKWSSSGWEFAGIDYIGTQNPAQWTTAVINLHLPYGKGNPPMQCSASNGSWASIAIDLATNTIREATFPKAGVNYECNTVHNGPVPTSAAIKGVSPLTGTQPAYVIAQENDVGLSNVFGSWANIQTPSFSSNIYNDMDQNISVLINQLWTTGDFTQLGWTITKTAGCAGTGINTNSADLGFVDSSTKGNYCIYNIPTFTYTAGINAYSQTLCNGGSTYTEQMTYNGVTWQHPTNISCSTHQNTNQDNNSVFFENLNTVTSSNWSGDVTGTVQSSGAKEIINSNIQNWTTSNPHQVKCGGTQTNTVLTGSLAGNGVAKWQSLNTMPTASC
jgi:hypothetical protein